MIELDEEWRDVPGHEGIYSVSSLGRVRNRAGKILKHEVTKSGHHRITLYTSGTGGRRYQVHRLVALAFLGASNLDVLHWDDNPSNNRLDNLRYGTDRENYADSVRNGKRRFHLTQCPQGHEYTYQDSGKKRCRVCENKKSKEVYNLKVGAGIPEDDPRHGAYAGYRAGCRLVCCSQANSVYKALWYQAKKRGL